ncbi:MAG: nickel pincer cofactor biosynthesis protein LarB [Myxococcota bacterium]
MDPDKLRALLDELRAGRISTDDAVEALRSLPFQELGYATVDHHRALRQGFPEVVLGQGKSAEQIAGIARELLRGGGNILVTRVDAALAADVRASLPELRYEAPARCLVLERRAWEDRGRGAIAIVSAGTSDGSVAEEAALTAHMMGNRVERAYDVGVAGIHRVLAKREMLAQATVVVVVAGMEGALASVVGGLIGRPIIAVPTSVGYGASFGGIAALLGMLNSCAAGVSVVNIDNGFGAAFSASLINRRDGVS